MATAWAMTRARISFWLRLWSPPRNMFHNPMNRMMGDRAERDDGDDAGDVHNVLARKRLRPSPSRS